MRLTSLFHPSHPRGGHPPHSNLVRGKLTSPTPTLQETGPTVLRPIREDLDCLYFPSPSEPNPSPPTPTQEIPPGLDESWYMLIIREHEVYK